MPPKGKRTAVPEEAFLFVNEDFSTLFGGAKNTHLDRTKQSHVQRQSFAKRRKNKKSGKQSRSKSSTPSEGAPSPVSSGPGPSTLHPAAATHAPITELFFNESLWLSPQEADTAQVQSLELAARPAGQRWLASASTNALRHPATFSGPHQERADVPPFEADQTAHNFWPASVINPVIVSGHHPQAHTFPTTQVIDPFTDFQAALEMWAPALMRYYTMIIMEEVFHTELKVVTLHEMRHVEDLHADMRSCMSSPAEMYALLAASASHSMAKYGRLDLPGLGPEDYNRVVLLLISKSFESLRRRLADGAITHSTVIATQRMVCAALVTSSLSAVEPHCRAVISMIEQIGGLNTFNDYEKERLIMQHFYYVLRIRRAPEFKVEWDPGSFESNVHYEVFSNMSNAFTTAGSHMRAVVETAQVHLHPIVAQAVLELVNVQQVVDWLSTQQYRAEDYRWLMQRRLAIMHRLLSVPSSPSATSSDLVRWALICFFFLSRFLPCGETRSFFSEEYIAPTLRLWTAESLEEAFSGSPETLLWVMIIFGIELTLRPKRDAQLGTMDATGVTEMATYVCRRVCRNLGITTDIQLMTLLKEMLLDDEIMDERYLYFVEYELGMVMGHEGR